jgi:adenine-specific DNA-methyltransferase
MHTHGVKYIGSKRTLVGSILSRVQNITPKTMLDVFTGTTRVAQAFRKEGWSVVSSDLSWASEPYAALFLQTTPDDLPLLESLVKELNAVEGVDDWITKTYCDVQTESGGLVRMWKPKNGRKADGIRNKIQEWEVSGRISHKTAMTLVAILILALDAVDNSVGVQQAYLKSWATRTDNELVLRVPDDIVRGPVCVHHVGNCLTVPYPSASLAYLDPPYSSHSYATYYHIWDSITRWDKPAVVLNTNRRIDRADKTFDPSMKSDWNNKKKAITAFETLLQRLPVRYILLSYSNESLLSLDQLRPLLERFVSYDVSEIDYTRNIMSQIGNASLYDKERETKNVEYLILIDKGVDAQPCQTTP